MAGCGKESGWTPVRYYIMYEVIRYCSMSGWVTSETVKKVKLLKNVAGEEGAKMEATKWLKRMRKKNSCFFKLKSARLVASIHKDILELT